MCGCANKHNFGFLRVKLKKIDEMPVVNGICALMQIVKLFGDTVVGEDRVKARVVCVLVKRHVKVLVQKHKIPSLTLIKLNLVSFVCIV